MFVLFARRLSLVNTASVWWRNSRPRPEHRNNTTHMPLTTPLQTDNMALTKSTTPPPPCGSGLWLLGSWAGDARWGGEGGVAAPRDQSEQCNQKSGCMAIGSERREPIVERRNLEGFIFSTRPAFFLLFLFSFLPFQFHFFADLLFYANC